jgi:hypothetical protein
MNTTRRELPGDVVIAFRQFKGRTRTITAFAELAGTNYSKIHRWESIRWGVDPSKWKGVFDMEDLQIFIDAGMMKEGDEWYQRFQNAAEWQARVLQYGSIVYQGIQPEAEYAPILEEHLSAVVQAVVSKAIGDMGPSWKSRSEVVAEVERKVYAAVHSMMEAVGLLVAKGFGEGPEEDVTRGLLQGLTTASSGVETPYVRSLRCALRSALASARGELAEIGGAEGEPEGD